MTQDGKKFIGVEFFQYNVWEYADSDFSQEFLINKVLPKPQLFSEQVWPNKGYFWVFNTWYDLVAIWRIKSLKNSPHDTRQ